jgi:hypothetical protein
MTMSGAPKEKRKKTRPKYEEIARGKVYNVQFPDRNFTWIDLRSEEKKKFALSGKDLGGEYKREGKFDQLVFVSDQYFRGATPFEVWKEAERIKRAVTQLSGSADVAVMTSSSIYANMPTCKKCGTPLFIVGEGFRCQKCGEPTVSG